MGRAVRARRQSIVKERGLVRPPFVQQLDVERANLHEWVVAAPCIERETSRRAKIACVPLQW